MAVLHQQSTLTIVAPLMQIRRTGAIVSSSGKALATLRNSLVENHWLFPNFIDPPLLDLIQKNCARLTIVLSIVKPELNCGRLTALHTRD